MLHIHESLLNLAEVAVQPSPIVFQKAASPFINSSIRSEGEKGDQTKRRNQEKRSKSFNGKKTKSPDQEEIIALLKRIRISISKGDSQNTVNRSSDADKDKPSTESSRDTQGEPKKQVKARNISDRAKEKDLSAVSRVEQEAREHQHISGFKLTRQPSNFVKKSPIPSLSTPRGSVIELTNDASPAIMVDTKVQSERLEELKLAELKALAKSRRVNGYSKMKKSELIKILES